MLNQLLTITLHGFALILKYLGFPLQILKVDAVCLVENADGVLVAFHLFLGDVIDTLEVLVPMMYVLVSTVHMIRQG